MPSSLQIDLAQRVVGLIKDGTFARGAHLTEQALAARWGVSRTPVRAALRLLEQQGFVEVRNHSGVFVSDRALRLKAARVAPDTMTEDDLHRAIISDRARHKLASTFTESQLLADHAAPRSLLTRVLLRLTREGLIERRKGHGWSFAPMLDSREALQESYRFRMLVECGALRLGSFGVNLDELRQARAAHERFAAQGPRSRTAAAFYGMNADFHAMLARFSGNRFVEQAVRQQNLLRRFEEYASFVGRSPNVAESCREHLQIIDALEQGDRDWAAALLQHHLSAAMRL
jgi:DNA-binding GntR family transcriptional regulator